MVLVKEINFSNRDAQIIFGSYDSNLKLLEDILDVELYARGNILKLKGEQNNIEKSILLFHALIKKIETTDSLTHRDILETIAQIKNKDIYFQKDILQQTLPKNLEKQEIFIKSRKEFIYPQSTIQKNYIKAIKNYSLTVGIGPAGTGKTYLAVSCAIESIKKGLFRRVILTRPALEAGERLGFLPGDLEEKIKPYLQPIYDALYDIMKYDELKKWTDQKIIEIIPLAYMRGRTLSDAFIILDEAQNTTTEQIKMFLTRLGINSKAVVTGDITQIDQPLTMTTSGLVVCEKVLKGIKDIKFIYFSEKDVVRHYLVKKIIKAYTKYNEKNEKFSYQDNNKQSSEKEKN
ncbi:MAG: PhoH family protein [Candidatus Omnitrophica bacterium]|jgi:phosphate starvation-inducible PhoH-like protein|nr:PhoH family protein [Candidatus Omnitrophota bacterium]